MIKALIFDFDGLIIDTETPDFQTWAEIYAEHGATLSQEKWMLNVGTGGFFNPYQHLEEQIGHEVDRTSLRDQRVKRYRELCEQQPILPGVVEMIQEAKVRDLKLAVASNSFGKWVNGHLKRLDLFDNFDEVICLDQITIGKPEPKMHLTTLSLLGVKAHEAIVFEDSPAGAMGAKRAGIYTIAIPNGITQQMDFSHCDRVVESMASLDMDKMLQLVIQSQAPS